MRSAFLYGCCTVGSPRGELSPQVTEGCDDIDDTPPALRATSPQGEALVYFSSELVFFLLLFRIFTLGSFFAMKIPAAMTTAQTTR